MSTGESFPCGVSEHVLIGGAGQADLENGYHFHASGAQSRRERAMLCVFIHEQADLAHGWAAVWLCCVFKRSYSACSSANSCSTAARLAW